MTDKLMRVAVKNNCVYVFLKKSLLEAAGNSSCCILQFKIFEELLHENWGSNSFEGGSIHLEGYRVKRKPCSSNTSKESAVAELEKIANLINDSDASSDNHLEFRV